LAALALAAAGAGLAQYGKAGLKKGFSGNIEAMTAANPDYRRVLYTAQNMQLVLMTLRPGDEIGEEIHEKTDQFFRVESGEGQAWINGARSDLKAGAALLVPLGARHNVKNVGDKPLMLYTIYAPPQHQDGTVQATKADASRATERFDGKTTE
jgi:mannose-6-phosphate isomerase-like protein (cupin superfamily)